MMSRISQAAQRKRQDRVVLYNRQPKTRPDIPQTQTYASVVASHPAELTCIASVQISSGLGACEACPDFHNAWTALAYRLPRIDMWITMLPPGQGSF